MTLVTLFKGITEKRDPLPFRLVIDDCAGVIRFYSVPQTNSTYLTIELKNSAGEWQVEYTDASWDTKYVNTLQHTIHMGTSEQQMGQIQGCQTY
jgi:PhoPQ-activated pathogenicity-related protein